MFRTIVVFAILATVAARFSFGGKKVAAPVKPVAPPKPSFAGGLVGSDSAEVDPFGFGSAGEFDPFGLSVGKSDETLAWYRAAELKHGRVAMLASAGLVFQPVLNLPDDVFDASSGIGGLAKLYSERPEALWQILIAITAIEANTLFSGKGTAGDFEWDPLNIKPKTEEKLAAMQLKELKNGRLAMIMTAGILTQELVSGKGIWEIY